MKLLMYTIATTRFNTKTWNENERWREKNNWDGCIYGTPTKMSENITPLIPLFILEMHNDINKIKGIGLIRNAVVIKKHYKIYSDGNYNRYTYKSKYRINTNILDHEEKKVIEILEVLVFKGSRHLKRGHGITRVPGWLENNKHINFSNKLKQMFVKRFS
tara:strand:+ start:1369 stop:1848 length:480 start_codon:yes stop_codon:yes gene_type:complete